MLTSELEERCIPVTDLRIGMFVCRLDRSWDGTPFPLQGVEVLRDSDLLVLRDLCQSVYIDARREITNSPSHMLTRTQLAESRFESAVNYDDDTAFDDELPHARDALANTSAMVDFIFAEVGEGREPSAEYVEQAVQPMVASILRSPDAFLWVESLRAHDSYTYEHAVSCSVLAAVFGRHMGFAEDTIMSLAAGGLMMDIGKTRVPDALLQRDGDLDEHEMGQVRRHVEYGLDILADSGITDTDVADIVRHHHERYDGSGYPDGLMGNGIPLSSRMLGIIDSYDAATSVRPYRAPLSRHHAMRQIYAGRDLLFQSELVEQFQVCLGVYPTGSLVELSTGEVAVVMGQNSLRRLRPKLVILSDPDKQPLPCFRSADLMQAGERADIVRTLVASDYAYDAAELFLQ